MERDAYVNNTLGVGMDIWFGNGQGENFSRWTGLDSSMGQLSEGECRTRGHIT